MSDEQQHTLPREEAVDRIWELAEKIDICMFTTWDGTKQRSRPMSARIRRGEHAIYFLTDRETHKLDEVEHFPDVSLAFADTHAHKYVVIAGRAEVLENRALIADLWTDFDKAWWEDASDPRIRVVRVEPERGELWDSPGRLVAGAQMLVAAVTGARTDMGDTANVRL